MTEVVVTLERDTVAASGRVTTVVVLVSGEETPSVPLVAYHHSQYLVFGWIVIDPYWVLLSTVMALDIVLPYTRSYLLGLVLLSLVSNTERLRYRELASPAPPQLDTLTVAVTVLVVDEILEIARSVGAVDWAGIVMVPEHPRTLLDPGLLNTQL